MRRTRRLLSVACSDESGSATVLMAGVLGVVVAIGLVAMTIAVYALAYHRVRAAADLAALSGAVAYGKGDDACGAAAATARANGAEVSRCDAVGDVLGYVVTVEARVLVPTRAPGLPRSVQARAFAGPVA